MRDGDICFFWGRRFLFQGKTWKMNFDISQFIFSSSFSLKQKLSQLYWKVPLYSKRKTILLRVMVKWKNQWSNIKFLLETKFVTVVVYFLEDREIFEGKLGIVDGKHNMRPIYHYISVDSFTILHWMQCWMGWICNERNMENYNWLKYHHVSAI